MNQPPNQTDFPDVLEADENVIWQGPISFNFFSSPIFTLALVVVIVFTIWVLDGYVAGQSGGSNRQQFGNVAIRPFLIVLLFFQILKMLERCALSSGRAKGQVILTNRRLLRICDWPKLRVRSCDYHGKRITAIGGFLSIGEWRYFVLSRQDATTVRHLIMSQKEA